MIKTNFLIFFPLFFNSIIFLIIILPSKSYKFHPINFIIILIILTFFISCFINFLFKSWISYFLFLTIIGGIIIIFLYIIRLINNNILSFNFINLIFFFIKLIIFSFFFLLIINCLTNLSLTWNNFEFWKISNFLEKKNELNLRNLYFNKKSSILFLINYLFFSIICIINICYKFKSPLRQINHYE